MVIKNHKIVNSASRTTVIIPVGANSACPEEEEEESNTQLYKPV
jgi:hypothetical protein